MKEELNNIKEGHWLLLPLFLAGIGYAIYLINL